MLGLVAWIYLLALVIVVAAEINVVPAQAVAARAADAVHRRGAAHPADERAYTGYAESERHKGFEVVDVGFGPPPEEAEADEPREPD